jgi:crotonobetainyl-CoA:carnitine CoA-transferase CaiB-like acyl-CoA transferase
MPGALDGIRIISMAEQYPGPYCTMLLADMGADVILVERPGTGDPARGSSGMSDHFAALSRNKRSITVDAKAAAGRDIIRQLAVGADVLVEGYRPGVMQRLGLDYPALQTLNPRLVYCSISGYGQDGPYRDRPAHDLSYQGLAGMLAAGIATGQVGDHAPVPIGDLSSAMFAALGIVAALLARSRTGSGQFIDVSMTDGLVSWMGSTLMAVMTQSGSLGVRTIREPAYGVFRCADGGYLTLSIAFEDHFWRRLCAALDRPELAGLSNSERLARVDELSAWLQSTFLSRPRDTWVDVLSRADVPAGPALSLSEVLCDPHLNARSLFGRLETDGGAAPFVNHPLHFSATPARVQTPPPRLGEHTEAVLCELGYDTAAIAALREQRAI